MDRPDHNEPSATPGLSAGSADAGGYPGPIPDAFPESLAASDPSGPGRPAPGPPWPGQPAPGQPGAPGPDRPFLDVPGAPPTTKGAAGIWFLFALIGFAGGQVVAVLLTYIAAAVAGEGGQLHKIASLDQPPEWYVGTSLVGLWVGFLAGPWIASKARGTGRFVADLGVQFRPIDLLGIVIGPAAQLLIGILYAPFASHLKHFTAPTQRLTGASHGGGFVVIAVMTVVCAPFFEELFFRGLLFKALARLFTPTAVGPSARRTVGIAVAVVVDGLLFGAAHGELVQLAGLAVFGAIMAFITYRTGRLGMNMVSHASFNLVAVLVVANHRGLIWH
ncbi:MAG TPA: CPBP family intramembrane glutamic endopeptidase [Acidimicrobiales bacterium]|nr:CPBP family intramembrane glutamic endopeptidase [Acidimicrobiales bacterium]